ncbi:ribonuclease H-like protein [Schizophyllum commune Tattone D]|nr:ribonuclease H-like protein [Schizophyllum commune Tattone D]
MCFSSYPLSRVRARTFPPAQLPNDVVSHYVDDIGVANALLDLYFPATGPNANFPVVAYDLENSGMPYSTREARRKKIPFEWNSAHFLRLLTIARDGVVIALDLWALGRIPDRVIQIFADGAIIKVGVALKGDSIFCVRHYAVPVYNGWELSNLWKCMHPHMDVGPLTSCISVDDMARLLIGRRVDKSEQNSHWGDTILSEEQIRYAILDAYILLPIYHAVRREYDSGVWPLFDTSAFAFNVDIVENGLVVQPGPQTKGSAVRVWGVGQPIPVGDGGDWAPTHPVLDSYRTGICSDCRTLATRRFITKEVKIVATSVYTFIAHILTFSWFRICRFVYVYYVELLVILSILAVPAIARVMYMPLLLWGTRLETR